MSPTENRTMSFPGPATAGRRAPAHAAVDFPAVIRAIFQCTRNVTLHQSLESLGAKVDPLGAVRPAYATEQGPPIVTVWHDRIEADVDGSLVYRLDSPDSAHASHGAAFDEAAALLARHVGQDVYVLLLKRDPDAPDPRRAGRNAPDIVMWTLEATRDGRLVLRRPTAAVHS